MRILLAPEFARGRGTGHVKRSLRLLAELPDAALLVPEGGSGGDRSALVAQVPPGSTVYAYGPEWDAVVLDRFAVSAEEVRAFGDAFTIGLDAGGEGREYCSCLIDTLLRVRGGRANRTDPGLLHVPEPRPLPDDATGRFLVTLGGEDPAELTEATAAAVVRAGVPPSRVTVVRPLLRALGSLPPGVVALEPQPSLWPVMECHEWVVCGFGLTAYEAASMGRLVVVLSPTAYHRTLARAAGFVDAGSPAGRRMASIIGDPARVRRQTAAAVPQVGGSLAGVIGALEPPARMGCPVHPGRRGRAVWRGADRTYFRCPRCGLVYMERFAGHGRSYGRSYFFDEYRQQYGRTYLEDFESIRETGRRRARVIRRLLGGTGSVLDVGCAFGPFLAAARDEGFAPYGVDVSPEAVEHVTVTRGLPAVNRSVLDLDPVAEWGIGQFDAVSLWYVVEHFPDLDAVLPLLARWVRPGGVLAISTPHLRGVSGRRRPDDFFARSPADHFTIWSEGPARRVLGEHGFRVRKVYVTGHHPERYPGVGRWLPAGAARLHSHVLGWGDTFEIYARRRRHA